jgi:hypothetical protein
MNQTACHKVGYASAQEAHEVARIIRSGKHRGRGGKHTRAYQCPRCHAYHLTSEREITK